MAVSIDIEKNLKGFQLRVRIKSNAPTMGILGASGSGKSMTLRCIAGIETPDAGHIEVNGRTLFDSDRKINQKPQERRVGYLFQNYALFPAMTVEQNLACGCRGSRREALEKAAEFVARYQLAGLEKLYPAQLSGGQQQRAALARMMMSEPDMILLDEPFSAQDGYLKDIVQRDMQNFLRSYEGDMMLVTHNRDEAFKFCEQLTLLKNGKTLNSGDTREIFENPGSVEAARLTGCKNFSRAERLDEHHVFARDWGLRLCTKERVGEDISAVAVRGHWLRTASQPGKNTMPVERVEYIENTFEHQFLIKNRDVKDAGNLWWMCQKKSFMETAELPEYLYFPPEHLMLLRD